MAFKVFVAIAIIGFVGAQAFVEQRSLLDNMVQNIVTEYEKTVEKFSQENQFDVPLNYFEKQGTAPEVERDLRKFVEQMTKFLAQFLSEASKECLVEQHEKVKVLDHETLDKVLACREDKRDEVNETRKNALVALIEAKEKALALKEKATKCTTESSSFIEAVQCLKEVAQEANDSTWNLAKALKEAVSSLWRLTREVASCTRSALKVYRTEFGQLQKNARECLKLTDN